MTVKELIAELLDENCTSEQIVTIAVKEDDGLYHYLEIAGVANYIDGTVGLVARPETK